MTEFKGDPIPMELSNERVFESAARGPLYVWDIDGTYLETDLSSAAGMLAIPFEFAIDKVAVPGSVPLLQGLRHGLTARSELRPLYFVSASPPQMRRVIERKMVLDGVEFDGIAFKDQLRMVFQGRIRDLTRQVGYKLAALIRYRTVLPVGTQWMLFGDDLESDGEIFAVFSAACAGLRGRALESELVRLGTSGSPARFVVRLAETLPPGDPIASVHIRLARRTGAGSWLSAPRELPAMEGRLWATSDYLQTALVLHHRGTIGDRTVRAVAREVARRGRAAAADSVREVQSRFEIDSALGAEIARGG